MSLYICFCLFWSCFVTSIQTYCVFNGCDLTGVCVLEVLTACWNATHDQQEAHTGNWAALLHEAKTAFSIPPGFLPIPRCCFRVSGACHVSPQQCVPPGQNWYFCVAIVVGLLSEEDVIHHRVTVFSDVACGRPIFLTVVICPFSICCFKPV